MRSLTSRRRWVVKFTSSWNRRKAAHSIARRWAAFAIAAGGGSWGFKCQNATKRNDWRARTPGCFDRFDLDEANARLLSDGTPVALAPTPFGVLCALARQPGSLLTTNALLDQVWGHQFVTDSVLRTAISELRTALDDDAHKPRFIETVSRRGYRFIAPTSALVVALPAAALVTQNCYTDSSSLIGRAEALSRLRINWDLACTGRRRIVWLPMNPESARRR